MAFHGTNSSFLENNSELKDKEVSSKGNHKESQIPSFTRSWHLCPPWSQHSNGPTGGQAQSPAGSHCHGCLTLRLPVSNNHGATGLRNFFFFFLIRNNLGWWEWELLYRIRFSSFSMKSFIFPMGWNTLDMVQMIHVLPDWKLFFGELWTPGAQNGNKSWPQRSDGLLMRRESGG